jgi:hypothetical protein
VTEAPADDRRALTIQKLVCDRTGRPSVACAREGRFLLPPGAMLCKLAAGAGRGACRPRGQRDPRKK